MGFAIKNLEPNCVAGKVHMAACLRRGLNIQTIFIGLHLSRQGDLFTKVYSGNNNIVDGDAKRETRCARRPPPLAGADRSGAQRKEAAAVPERTRAEGGVCRTCVAGTDESVSAWSLPITSVRQQVNAPAVKCRRRFPAPKWPKSTRIGLRRCHV